MDNQEKNLDQNKIPFDNETDKSGHTKDDKTKQEKDGKGIDYVPPTPEPASDSTRKHDDPIRDHNPSVL